MHKLHSALKTLCIMLHCSSYCGSSRTEATVTEIAESFPYQAIADVIGKYKKLLKRMSAVYF